MSYLTGFRDAPIGLYSTTSLTTPVNSDLSLGTVVGSKWSSDDGREFMLVQAGAVALPAGVVVQGPAAQTNAVGLSPATAGTTGYNISLGPIVAAIGGKTIQLATGATAVLVNRFQGGYLTVVSGTGLGQTMAIASNTVASTTSAMGVVLEDPFTTATDSTSRYSLTINPFGSRSGTDFSTDGVIISPATTLTGQVLGVTLYPIPASTATVASFGVIQTKGPVVVLGSSTVALGLDVGVPGTVAGAPVAYAVASTTRIGTTLVVSAAGAYNLVNLQL